MEEKKEEQKPVINTKPRDFIQAPNISNEPDRAADPQKGWAGSSWSGERWAGRSQGGRDR